MVIINLGNYIWGAKYDLFIKTRCMKMSKYGVFSGPYFPIFNPNTGKCGPENTPYLDTFHLVT